MRVKCVKIFDVSGSREVPRRRTEWLTIGKEYPVLSVEVGVGQPAYLRIIGDDGHTPGLHIIQQFVTVSSRIPSSWLVQVGENGYLEMAPASWLRPGFWEDYFNGQADAVAQFEAERARIHSESNEA
jgi:hypothetical protein